MHWRHTHCGNHDKTTRTAGIWTCSADNPRIDSRILKNKGSNSIMWQKKIMLQRFAWHNVQKFLIESCSCLRRDNHIKHKIHPSYYGLPMLFRTNNKFALILRFLSFSAGFNVLWLIIRQCSPLSKSKPTMIKSARLFPHFQRWLTFMFLHWASIDLTHLSRPFINDSAIFWL